MIARFWSYLTSLNLARPNVSESAGASRPRPQLWLERDVDAAVARHPAGQHR